jgi:hypothetical protein
MIYYPTVLIDTGLLVALYRSQPIPQPRQSSPFFYHLWEVRPTIC